MTIWALAGDDRCLRNVQHTTSDNHHKTRNEQHFVVLLYLMVSKRLQIHRIDEYGRGMYGVVVVVTFCGSIRAISI